jgi:hypothetical protein
MIVKDEAHVIGRCIESVRPMIDTWTIVDTGSTDGTQQLVTSLLSDIPGTLHERPWRNFGSNRSEALELAREAADYSLIVDADEVLELPPAFSWPPLVADGYSLTMVTGTVTYRLERLVANRLPWRYRGVIHEYIECETPARCLPLDGPRIVGLFDGGRGAGLTQAEKYTREAELLEQAVADEPDNPRYRYYLARSYLWAGQWANALESFQQRATMGGHAEEVYDSLINVAGMNEQLGADPDVVVAAYLAAFECRPIRAEPLCELARYLRQNGRYRLAHLFASYAEAMPRPENEVLWVDEGVYRWRARDELGVAASWIGRNEESSALCRDLLSDDRLPDNERARVQANLELAESRLADRPGPTG